MVGQVKEHQCSLIGTLSHRPTKPVGLIYTAQLVYKELVYSEHSVIVYYLVPPSSDNDVCILNSDIVNSTLVLTNFRRKVRHQNMFLEQNCYPFDNDVGDYRITGSELSGTGCVLEYTEA